MSLFLRIEDATSLTLDGASVTTPEMYLAWQMKMLLDRRIARRWFSIQRPVACVNHGRWIVHCPACGQGAFTNEEWRMACCAVCGAVYEQVVFPNALKRAAIVGLLTQRPIEAQNWVPGEPVSLLLRENVEHGVAS